MSHELLDLEPTTVSPVQEHLGETATGTQIEVEAPDEGIPEQIDVQVRQEQEALDADPLSNIGQT